MITNQYQQSEQWLLTYLSIPVFLPNLSVFQKRYLKYRILAWILLARQATTVEVTLVLRSLVISWVDAGG